ncbi:MAG: DUF2851 family protein, partial [Lentisphaerae bacterium]|nr:DUF2851 family protein [Lentisphaerota bacterium]
MQVPVQDCRGFARADGFCRLTGSDMVRERSAAFGYTERHVKCVWYDPRLRPARLHDMRREPVEVENPGRWNLEAGPDFLDALLLVGAKRRR